MLPAADFFRCGIASRVTLKVPVNPEFVATLGTDLGPVEFRLLEPVAAQQQVFKYTLGGKEYKILHPIPGKGRILQRARGWWDAAAGGVSKFEAVQINEDGSVEHSRPVVAIFQARPSRLNDRMFASVGELGQ